MEMTNLPLVSVIIPCYNHEKFVRDCLDSLIGQTYPNIEIIVFDDCSSDQSFDIIQEYKEILENRFENVIIRQNEVNLGVTKTLNRMIQLSKGTYIKPIASDDMMISNAIEEMIFCLEHNKSHNILISNGIKISEESSYSNVIKKDIIYESNPNFSGDDFMFRIALNNILFAPGAIYKKEIFDLYGLFDEEIAVEDFEFWLRMIKNKEKIVFLEKTLIYYRLNENSMTSIVHNKKVESRRIKIHSAEMDSIYKYKDCFTKKEFNVILVKRIIDEKRIASLYGMHDLSELLKKEWKLVFKSKGLSIIERARYGVQYRKQDLKYHYMKIAGRY